MNWDKGVDISVLQGWLNKEKRNALLKNIVGDKKRRWFTVEQLNPGECSLGEPELALCYSHGPEDKEYRGWMYMKDIESISELGYEGIIISSSARTLRLHAQTRAEHKLWIISICLLCPHAVIKLDATTLPSIALPPTTVPTSSVDSIERPQKKVEEKKKQSSKLSYDNEKGDVDTRNIEKLNSDVKIRTYCRVNYSEEKSSEKEVGVSEHKIEENLRKCEAEGLCAPSESKGSSNHSSVIDTALTETSSCCDKREIKNMNKIKHPTIISSINHHFKEEKAVYIDDININFLDRKIEEHMVDDTDVPTMVMEGGIVVDSQATAELHQQIFSGMLPYLNLKYTKRAPPPTEKGSNVLEQRENDVQKFSSVNQDGANQNNFSEILNVRRRTAAQLDWTDGDSINTLLSARQSIEDMLCLNPLKNAISLPDSSESEDNDDPFKRQEKQAGYVHPKKPPPPSVPPPDILKRERNRKSSRRKKERNIQS